MNRTARWATAVGAVAALMLGAGCADIGTVESLQAEVEALKSEQAAARNAAESAAAEAQAEAQAARAAAGDAASAAASAMNAANEAQAGSAANAEKIDRMSEKMMMK